MLYSNYKILLYTRTYVFIRKWKLRTRYFPILSTIRKMLENLRLYLYSYYVRFIVKRKDIEIVNSYTNTHTHSLIHKLIFDNAINFYTYILGICMWTFILYFKPNERYSSVGVCISSLYNKHKCKDLNNRFKWKSIQIFLLQKSSIETNYRRYRIEIWLEMSFY